MGVKIQEKHNKFQKDLQYILNLTGQIDNLYANNSQQTIPYLKSLRKIIDKFNDKYPNIHVALGRNHQIFLRFFIRDNSPNKVYRDFEKVDNKFAWMSVDSTKVYTTNPDNSLALRINSSRNMVEVIYQSDSITNPKCPEFRLLASHALDGSNPDLAIDKDDDFCFNNSRVNGQGIIYRATEYSESTTY